jgi:cytochrome c553
LSRIAIARNVTTAFAGQDEIPRLAGQRQGTIVKALHDYHHGARRGRGNFIMPEIAYSLDDTEAIAHFMSREGADAKP